MAMFFSLPQSLVHDVHATPSYSFAGKYLFYILHIGFSHAVRLLFGHGFDALQEHGPPFKLKCNSINI